MTRKPSAKKPKKQRNTNTKFQLRGGSGVFAPLQGSRAGAAKGYPPNTATARIVTTALCRRVARIPRQSNATTIMQPPYFFSGSSRVAFDKYNVLSCLGLCLLALLPCSAFWLSRSVHLERTRLNRSLSAMRWSTFGTRPYFIILSMRSRFSSLPFPARPSAAPRGYFVPGFFSSAEVCMRWH